MAVSKQSAGCTAGQYLTITTAAEPESQDNSRDAGACFVISEVCDCARYPHPHQERSSIVLAAIEPYSVRTVAVPCWSVPVVQDLRTF